MKYIKMNVVRNDILSNWWYKNRDPLFKRVLAVNESKAPKRQFRLKRGGKA